MEINQNIAKVQYSLIRLLNEEARKFEDSIDLTIGEPDIATEKGIVEDACEYAMTHKLGYPPTGGGPKLRGILADYYNDKYGSSYQADNVIVNVGASEAICSCFRALLNIDDEVIVFTPFYAGYLPMIQMAYAKPVFVDISKTDFTVTPELLEKYITDKTKIILFCNPCNPSGNVMGREEIENIANYLANKDIFIVSDEIYSELSFGEFTSFASFPQIQDKLIIINGFSKSHSMTGWRVGYTIFPLEYRKPLLNTTLFTLSSPMAVSLAAAESAITKYRDRSHVRKIYQERAEFMYEKLVELGFKVVKPKGAFYIFADYTDISDLNSFDFAMDVLKEVQVALVPGISFGSEGYFRISLVSDIPRLAEAAERLKKYVENHKK
ncbi:MULTISPECIES: pyridoxal phosphate-dependent aminotransferase [Fusobacterium]|uniref:pyridoxal phosphate-dependent aminotransferase n=1 Tax=Fusobacterium TaxID=848 RepID=UPI001F4341F7|nr:MULTISPECIES: aminotransferase class I/II-fold pyridoxal phosphate-dependent enzyme [Fusobacterium]MCF2612006.1 aminotransferase class I/II-fold pyridoxal phosphate-dependent enzyme [Fusobacterium perfoetens]MDY2980125.1 aminotransferase class I/II-fold pyridoxal phosphate-dependent enzyme [Fusobacterium sp.]